MIRKFSVTMILLFTVLSSAIYASDKSDFRVLGFSKDGKYFAYECYGQKDGSGSVYSLINIVEVATGKECIKTIEAEDFDNLNLDSLRLANLNNAEIQLDKYRLNEDTKGSLEYKSKLPIFRSKENVKINKAGVAVVLKLTDTKKVCFPELKNKLVNLTLLKGKKETVLLAEKENKDICLVAARIERVILYKKSLVCILDYTMPGFEGVDTRQLVVTTILN